MSDYPSDRRYTEDHEWAKANGDVVVGVTAHAVDQLGDITLVSIDVAVGDEVQQAKAFGTIESVKTLSELMSPVTGTVTAINTALEDAPELVNEGCYDKGWLIKVAISDTAQLDSLLDAEGYANFVKSSSH